MQTNPISAPLAAEVRQDVDSEAAIIETAKHAISTCSWKLGECASTWTATWSRGRGDADFGALVGMSGDQVYQRRRVWDRWSHIYTDVEKPISYRKLSWSHFYAAVSWDDAESCLAWAYDNQATVSEMKAWRAAQRDDPPPANRTVSDVDPFEQDDPFGEGEEDETEFSGEDDGKDVDGTDSEEHEGPRGEDSQPSRPPRNGKEKPGGSSKPPRDPFVTKKAVAVKTAEALLRAIGDLNDIHRSPPKYRELKTYLRKTVETVKAWK